MNVIIEKIGMGTKPDPYKFEILELKHVGGNTIIEARYDGCTTFRGRKLMVLEGIHNHFTTLDPHFFEGHPIVARFAPTLDGWRLAELVAKSL